MLRPRHAEVRRKERPEAPAQSAPPVGGREDGTLWVRPVRTVGVVIQGRVGKRLRKRHRPTDRTATNPCDNPGHDPIDPRPLRRAHPSSALLVVAACGSATPSPSPVGPPRAERGAQRRAVAAPSASAPTGGDVDAIYDAIEAQVLELRGLQPADVERETIDEATLAAHDDRPTSTRTTPPTTSPPTSGCTRRSGCSRRTQSLRELYLDLHRQPGRRLLSTRTPRPCTSCRAAGRSTARTR